MKEFLRGLLSLCIAALCSCWLSFNVVSFETLYIFDKASPALEDHLLLIGLLVSSLLSVISASAVIFSLVIRMGTQKKSVSTQEKRK